MATPRQTDRRDQEAHEQARVSSAGKSALAGKGALAAFSVAVVVGLGAAAFGATSVTTAGSLRWVTAVILVVLLAATWLLCAHAGGHAWFVPLPALVLAVLWAITATGDRPGAAWWLVALSAAAAAVGVAVAGTALRQRWRTSGSAWPELGPDSQPQSRPELRGASGTALTSLGLVGVVRVAGETWTATSLSGPLPAGSPVHVVRVHGVRLDVWSEAGAVPDRRSLESLEQQEERA